MICTIFYVLSHLMLFCCKISLLCNLRCFVAKSVLSLFTRFGVEKNWGKNFVCGEKRTNIRYGTNCQLAQGPSAHQVQHSTHRFCFSEQCNWFQLFERYFLHRHNIYYTLRLFSTFREPKILYSNIFRSLKLIIFKYKWTYLIFVIFFYTGKIFGEKKFTPKFTQ